MAWNTKKYKIQNNTKYKSTEYKKKKSLINKYFFLHSVLIIHCVLLTQLLTHGLCAARYLILLHKNGSGSKQLFQDCFTKIPKISVSALQNIQYKKVRSCPISITFFLLCDSWQRRSLASRLIFLGPCFYLPYDELISSHGRKGRTNNHTNRWNSESCPFIIQNYCVSRKSCQTVTVCKWLGNVIVCHQKQMKSRIRLKDQNLCPSKTFPK